MKLTPPLPVKEGLAPSYLWLPQGHWPTMLAFLVERFPAVSAQTWQQRMARGEVRNQHGQLLTPDSPCQRGDCIFYYRDLEGRDQISKALSLNHDVLAQ